MRSAAEPMRPLVSIEVRGARQHNLKDVSLDIPKRQLTVFTGVSGSGKSSLVFGTVAAESQRLLNETYTAFVQSFMPSHGRPDVDSLTNLSAAILVDQSRMGANSRSTVGTATDAYAMLRILFSRLGRPHVGSAHLFSFNDPQGMCADCEGIGRVSSIDASALFDPQRSLDEGAITFPGFAVDSWFWTIIARSGFFETTKPLGDYTEGELDRLLYAPERKVRNGSFTSTYEGLVPKVRRLYLSKDVESLQPHLRKAVAEVVTFDTCATCNGARLSTAALRARIDGTNIAECTDMQVSDLLAWVRGIDDPEVTPLVATLVACLDDLVRIGLGYLSLARESGTLSGGESQRVKMVRHLGSALTDLTYVFDEPSIGLHPHDVQRFNELLLRLRDKGNTVLVVEHRPEVIAIADHVVDLGPGAGIDGGTITYEGDVAGLRSSDTLTGLCLQAPRAVRADVREPTEWMRIEAANLHNLRDVSVNLPTGVLTVVTGVAGSGKSSLIRGCLPRAHGEVVFVDQGLTRGSRRSNPATYTGMLDTIRTAFAKANGVSPALFSANSKGACPGCKGLGVVWTDLVFMAGVASPCEECGGRRYTPEVLTHRLRGKDISEVLGLPVRQARAFFTERPVARTLERMDDVGLGYLVIGQPLSTLSGGERQRLKLAIEMANAGQVYVLDEPTTGLHMHDVQRLLGLLDRLVDDGNTVIVIEHHLDVVARADWVVDLGPGAGHDGGRVVFEGTPAQLLGAQGTVTGRHLRERVENGVLGRGS